MKYDNLDTAVTAYTDFLVDNYEAFCRASKICTDENRIVERLTEFKDSIEVRKGKKYIKVLTNRSATAFIVAGDDPKFKVGDLLKAASFNAPAKNSARGNVLEGKFSGSWTGPAYLK